jgi:lipoyl(octanoyl) transferase
MSARVVVVVVLDLGRRQYGEVWELQKRLVALRASGGAPDTLLLVEHEHVITLGRRTTPENFRPQNIPTFEVERGGDATYHGPGQLVGYPIMKLADRDVHRYLRQLEETLIRTVAKFGIRGERKEGHTGVWVGGNKKVASIGVAISNWVTYHGFALNVSTDMTYFHLIKPCGLDPGTLSSMEQLLGSKSMEDTSMGAVKRTYLEEFSDVFGVQLESGELEDLVKAEPTVRARD